MTDDARPESDLDAVPPTAVVIPTDDDSIRRRRRALAPIQVLTGIEQNKSMLDGDFWQDYDLFTLALSVIDQVALAMGISAGRTWEEALEYGKLQAARQRPHSTEAEWALVAERVLHSLLSTDVEVVPYLAHGDDGPSWRAQRFRMLYLHTSGVVETDHLRASEAAINIFVNALDLDIEAAQIANEAQLNALIKRGAVASAVQLAHLARYQSIKYQERVRRIIADTLIDPDSHDWLDGVPQLLREALSHVSDRLSSEASLLEAVEERRDALHDTAAVSEANQLIEILRECRRRHDELHAHLIGARGRLREALDDRFRRPPRHTRHYDVGRELLSPMLERELPTANSAADRIVARLGGLRLAWLPPWASLIDTLCAPSRTPDEGDEYIAPDLDQADAPEWWEPYEAAVESVLDGISDPIRLSQLLHRVTDIAERLHDDNDEPLDADLLSATLIHAAHDAWAQHLSGRYAGDSVLVAVAATEYIDTPRVRCRDLVLVPGQMTEDLARNNKRLDAREMEHQ